MKVKFFWAMLLSLVLLINSTVFIGSAAAVATNLPPIAGNDEYDTPEGTTLVIEAPEGLLANDSDPDGDTLTIELRDVNYDGTFYSELMVTSTDMEVGLAGGTITISPDGSFSYTPGPGLSQEWMEYRLWDGTTYSGLAAEIGRAHV